MILTIARHELRRLFLSPLAWIILAVVEFILAWMFLQHVESFVAIQSLSMTEIVLGKYLGLYSFLLVQLLLIALMPLSLLAGGGLDFGLLASSLLGLALLLAGFAAVGLFMSTLTQHQTIAAVSTFGVLLFFWLLDWARTGVGGGALPYLSLIKHTEPFLKGVFDTRDVVYHVLFVATFLALSVRRLDMDRVGG
jgi:ABC-2 type transport system permease protein